jgi:hypothetical protein
MAGNENGSAGDRGSSVIVVQGLSISDFGLQISDCINLRFWIADFHILDFEFAKFVVVLVIEKRKFVKNYSI